MRFNGQQLDEYRRKLNRDNPSEEEIVGTDVCLFGVCDSLTKPVVKFVKLTKRYLYDEKNTKYYTSTYSTQVFTTEKEAWQYFISKFNDRKDKFEKEKQLLENAITILNAKMNETPEYFL